MKLTNKTVAVGMALILLLACSIIAFAEEIPFTNSEAGTGGAIFPSPAESPVNTGFTNSTAETTLQ